MEICAKKRKWDREAKFNQMRLTARHSAQCGFCVAISIHEKILCLICEELSRNFCWKFLSILYHNKNFKLLKAV